MDRIIVIGGLSAGPSAAAKARRENETVEIILFEKSPNISYATCGIPYALSGVIPSRDKLLVVEANLLRDRFNIDVKLNEEIIDIDPEAKIVTSSNGTYSYDRLIFTTGARAHIPKVENIEKVSNWSTCRSLGDFDKIMKEGILDSVKNITIMGAGLIGVEVAENISELGKNITLIEGNSQILPMWQPKFSGFAQTILQNEGINVETGSYAKRFIEDNGAITHIELGNGKLIETDFVILSTGIIPNTDMLRKKGAKTIGNGALIVNDRMETSLPDIYAAGDNVSLKNRQTGEQGYFPLGTHSNKGGRAAGANAAGGNESFSGAYKTAIIKIYEYSLARTGLNARELTNLGYDFKTNLIVTGSTPGYYPGQTDIIVEVYYDSNDLTILGAEIFGETGVDKRIDVLSTAIYAKLKITDLPQLDLAYAPPYSPAKDPVIVNGFVNSNTINDTYAEISVEELSKRIHQPEPLQLIDIRSEHEILLTGTIHDAQNIPLHDLRSVLDTIDNDIETVLFCEKGLRGYLAHRILQNNGFKNVRNLSGGYKIWSMLHANQTSEERKNEPLLEL